MVSSKWGYTYTADWTVDAEVPEVKDHSAAALARQWPETNELLGRWLRLYQVHSATLESGILDDDRSPAVAGRARRAGWAQPQRSAPIGDAPPGVDHRDRRHPAVLRGPGHLESPRDLGRVRPWPRQRPPGWTVIVKEALANGRLAVPGPATASDVGRTSRCDGPVGGPGPALGRCRAPGGGDGAPAALEPGGTR